MKQKPAAAQTYIPDSSDSLTSVALLLHTPSKAGDFYT
jgi:hypothetical protein